MTKEDMGMPRPSQWCEFVTRYSETVPPRLWGAIKYKGQVMLGQGADWQAFLDELVSGCQELMAGRLEQVVNEEIEAVIREGTRAGEDGD